MQVPFGIPSPRFLLGLIAIFLKTETELLFKSRNVYPQKLIDFGFEFKYKSFVEAVKDLC